MKFKAILVKILAIALVLSSILGTAYAGSADSGESALVFSDVSEDDYYYEAVMYMTAKGILHGTTTPVNGVGTYSPKKTMSRAEFLSVVTKIYFGSDVDALPKVPGAAWYANYYTVALKNGIVPGQYIRSDSEALKQGCTRQEMSMIIVNALKNATGEIADTLISMSQIPDWKSIDSAYMYSVKSAYSMGILTGVDSAGTFNPNGTLDRGQAALVLYKMMEKSERSTPNFDFVEATIVDGHQEFLEGSRHAQCKEGDVVIKADGTRVVLEKKWGILGASQGVDIWTGVYFPNTGVELGVGADWTDGSPILMDDRGETHTGMEWNTIREQAHPSREGHKIGYDGEVYNIWFTYYDGFGWSYDGPRQ